MNTLPDSILKNLPFKFNLKKGRDEFEQYAYDHSVKLHPTQQTLLDRTLKLEWAIMMSPPEELHLLQNLCRAIGAKRTLDIGVFTGCSALAIALALPADGKVIALDITDEHIRSVDGFELWKQAGVAGKIDLRLGNAVTALENLLETEGPNSFDFSYIDADKPNYKSYYDLSVKLVRSGGIIAVDNTFALGNITDPTAKDEMTEGMRALNRYIADDQRVSITFLKMSDGVTLCFKK